jgi:hypothetical protein
MNRFQARRTLLALAFVGWLAPSAQADPTLDLLLPDGLARGAAVRCALGDVFARTELFFGRSKPDGSVVTDEEWQAFLDRVVTPRFPDGLTVLMGTGQFKDQRGTIVREDSILLILLYPPGEPSSNRKIERIREVYKTAFQQQSVLRADSTACVSF